MRQSQDVPGKGGGKGKGGGSSFGSLESKKNSELSEAPFSECQYFVVKKDYHEELKRDFPLIDFERLFKRLKEYIDDNPHHYTMTGRGQLKSPKSVIRNWCEREVVRGERKPDDPIDRRLREVEESISRRKGEPSEGA